MRNKIIYKLTVTCFVLFVILWTCLPFYWLFVTSIASESEMRDLPIQLWPKTISLSRYRILFNVASADETRKFFPGIVGLARRFLPVLRNSAIVAISGTIIAMLLGVPAAYAFARYTFRGKGILMTFIIGSRVIPPAVIIVPLFLMVSRLGMVDNIVTIIVLDVTVVLPLIVWILWSYFAVLPRELEDAAKIDGCSTATFLLRVLIPVSAPGFVAAITVSFITIWNEFFYALIFTDSTASVTLPKLIASFGSEYGGLDYGLISAAAMLTIIPPALLALFLQRYIISGLTAGAAK